MQEERLRQILGVCRRMSLSSNEGIDGQPVDLTQIFHRSPSGAAAVMTGRADDAPLSRCEAIAAKFCHGLN